MLPQIPIVRITEAKSISLPRYPDGIGTSMVLTSSGSETIKINPHHFEVFKTGLAIALPVGIEAQIRSLKNTGETGVIVLGAPVTLDASDRKEITVTLYNASSDAVVVKHGEPIALLVFSPVLRVEWQDMTGGIISRIKRQADRQAAVEAMHKAQAPAEAAPQSGETALDEFEPVIPEASASTQEVPAATPETLAATQTSDAIDDVQQVQIFEQKEQEAFAEQEQELEQDQLLDEAQEELKQIEEDQASLTEPAAQAQAHEHEPEQVQSNDPATEHENTPALEQVQLNESLSMAEQQSPVFAAEQPQLNTPEPATEQPQSEQAQLTAATVPATEQAPLNNPAPATEQTQSEQAQLNNPEPTGEQPLAQGIEEPIAPPDILAEFERIERDFKPNE